MTFVTLYVAGEYIIMILNRDVFTLLFAVVSINSEELSDEVFSRYRNTFSGRNPAIMYTQPEQRAGTGNAGDSDINMWQLLL